MQHAIRKMTDITPDLNAALKSRNATPVIKHRYSLDQLDEFLKEAYSIVSKLAYALCLR